MESNPGVNENPGGFEDSEHSLRRYLLLLASLAATVTYAAGLAPPGGTWAESHGRDMAGSPILPATHHSGRYMAFYCCNATAFAASVVVMILLVRNKLEVAGLRALRTVMVLDLLALMAAYTTGGCVDKHSTVYTVTLVVSLVSYLGMHIFRALWPVAPLAQAPPPAQHELAQGGQQGAPLQLQELEQQGGPPQQTPAELAALQELELRRKVLMLLAIFVATITYVAGLKPPGGFWEQTNAYHRAGGLILTDQHRGRFSVFFYCNTTAFMASLFTMVLLLHRKVTPSGAPGLYGCVMITLQTLVGAYAAGSCRNIPSTTYIFALVGVVLACILLLAVGAQCTATHAAVQVASSSSQPIPRRDDTLGEIRSLVLLLATLMATITYQTGLNPPGGVWLENQDGHSAGDPTLSTTNNIRYTLFYCCNSVAFVASILVILMVKIKTLLQPAVLLVAMIFGLLGIMGAYISGSTQTLQTSFNVISLAAVFVVYVIVLLVVKSDHTPPNNIHGGSLKKSRKRLLLVAILVAALTYQAGLSPPGGFWRMGEAAGSPMLLDMYPRRYNFFFYCNTTSFMASIALIFLIQNKDLCGRRFKGLYLCMIVGLLGLIGAFAAGSERRMLKSLYVFLPVGVVFTVIAMKFPNVLCLRDGDENTNQNNKPAGDELRRKKKYFMLVAILAASVTYSAGLDPPGGVWPDGHGAWNGNSVLHDSNLSRYHVFFYGNSSSFMASVIVIILLLQDRMHTEKSLLRAMNIVVVLDLIGLLVAYAAGSTRTMKTSLYFIVPTAVVVIYILVRSVRTEESNNQAPGGNNSGDGQNNGATNGHAL